MLTNFLDLLSLILFFWTNIMHLLTCQASGPCNARAYQSCILKRELPIKCVVRFRHKCILLRGCLRFLGEWVCMWVVSVDSLFYLPNYRKYGRHDICDRGIVKQISKHTRIRAAVTKPTQFFLRKECWYLGYISGYKICQEMLPYL